MNTPDPKAAAPHAAEPKAPAPAPAPEKNIPHAVDDLAVDALEQDDDDETDTPVHPHQDELLDEGIEETFPASDPVSVKHIT